MVPPQNIVFVVVGDVKAAEVQAQVAKALDPGKPRLQACALSSEARQVPLSSRNFTGDIETTMAIVGVPGPAELDPDAPAVDMALAITRGRASSRLNQSCARAPAPGPGCILGMFNGQSPGLIYLWADLEAARSGRLPCHVGRSRAHEGRGGHDRGAGQADGQDRARRGRRAHEHGSMAGKLAITNAWETTSSAILYQETALSHCKRRDAL